MKVELVQFFVKEDSLCLYTLNGKSYAYAEKDNRLGVYLGEDDEHVWLCPLTFGHVIDDFGIPKSEDRIIIGAISRFIKDTVVLKEPEDDVAEVFGDMKYRGDSRLE